MAALCGIYYGVRTPLKFDSTSTSTRVFSFQALKWTTTRSTTRLRFTFPHFPPLSAVRNAGGARCSPLACSRRTQQGEDGLSTSGNPEEITQGPETYVSSIRTVALWVCMAVIFGVGVGFKDGVGKASEFFAGYLLEQSLSVDNLFVFVLIFKYFQVPTMYQGRVLSYGIAGAIIFRLSLILLGTATLQRFEAVNLLFAAILLFSSFKLFAADEDETDLSNNFVVKTCQKFIPVTASYDGNRFVTIQDGVWKATPLLLTVAVIELSDIAFAVDSIPAVFGVTRDPFIVFTSNLFAILGLRSLYTLISESMSELEYLQPSIGVVLGFIGCKMILDFFGFHVSTEASLGFVATSLGAGVLLSLMKKSD
ncbi:thylakoid membrane protein TERC, chloroplastic isoform X3 [Vitis riparia]|uniref:thylakoid membrane protein TERC, chloroplastic isoform X3 n=1 Tax=Vitis riparia TaxID=96939 RepID=UPI00155A4C5C|nr:thylakoid membrane protein TERC, chloroplastic isoform X3 [Vitis riparia]